MKYIISNLIKNCDVKLGNVPRWWESKGDIWDQMTISLTMTMTNNLFHIT